MGGGFGQGGYGGNAGTETLASRVQRIDNQISIYLAVEEIKNILTPGEYCEWDLSLKAGQVVIADARSDAFDPALEIVDAKEKVLASNDDRFPGDQRPLLLWRCEVAGPYKLRVRCFRNKSGGQFFMRYRVYDCFDLDSDNFTEKSLPNNGKFLFRLPMKAGQIKSIAIDVPDSRKYDNVQFEATISPVGLPDVGLSSRLGPSMPNAIVAPVDGDYYVLASAWSQGGSLVRAGIHEYRPEALAPEGDGYAASAPTGAVKLWRLPVRAGQILAVSATDLHYGQGLTVAEEPPFSSYDLSKPESNPFFPQAKDDPDQDATFTALPGRANDQRVKVVAVKRDAILWITASGSSPKRKFNVSVAPAARSFAEGSSAEGRLRIGYTDYWTFDAKAGDVMRLGESASDFAASLIFRGPALDLQWQGVALPDQTDLDWNLVAAKPGRYIVAVSSEGNGGAGAYKLTRIVLHAKEFGVGNPARIELSGKEAQVWKFSAKPDEPLLIRWKGAGYYSSVVRDEAGNGVTLPITAVSADECYGILKVEKPTTYLIVLTGAGSKMSGLIELMDLPEYGK
jgi:hypothetical protein